MGKSKRSRSRSRSRSRVRRLSRGHRKSRKYKGGKHSKVRCRRLSGYKPTKQYGATKRRAYQRFRYCLHPDYVKE